MEQQQHPDQLDRELTEHYRIDIPDGYRATWRAAVQREEQTKMKRNPKHTTPVWRVALPIAAALVLVVGALSAGTLFPTVVYDSLSTYAPNTRVAAAPAAKSAGSSAANEMVSAESASFAGYAFSPSIADSDAGHTNDTANLAQADVATIPDAASQKKMVRTASLSIASTNFDVDQQALTTLTQTVGGYVESVSLYGEASSRMDRIVYFTLRIPSDQLDTFLTELGKIGRITSRSETATDMTTQYADTSMRLTTQQNKMTRLQELLKQATDTSDLLEIETAIADTQYQIDQLESSLRTIDRDVDHSSVSITLQEESAGETAQVTELTLWQRLSSGFTASIKGLGEFLQNLLVFLAMALPVLVPLTIVGVAFGLWKRARRRSKGTSKADVPDVAPHDPADPTV